jgi:cell division protein ZapE
VTPLQRYQSDLQKPGFVADAAQEMAIVHLQDLYERLVASEEASRPGMARWWSSWRRESVLPEQGLYFWGGVGRGKTYLMDLFFECLPFERKLRAHFHRFMHRVHAELNELREQRQKDPLQVVAVRIAREARVICFDEFFVSDIADAMILGGLFEALFRNGVTLVATSNIVPDELYRKGLQRERFLPAIEMLKAHTRVLNIDGGTDYRLRTLEQVDLYHHPLNAEAEARLRAGFERLAPDEITEQVDMPVNGRVIRARYLADDVAWFEFVELCERPRSPADYIELARVLHAVVLANIPALNDDRNDQARRFINLIDEFYDRNVKMVISAQVPLLELYTGQRLAFEFERTCSRLLEMQSREYLARPHKP